MHDLEIGGELTSRSIVMFASWVILFEILTTESPLQLIFKVSSCRERRLEQCPVASIRAFVLVGDYTMALLLVTNLEVGELLRVAKNINQATFI